ncbi:MAG: DUF695 domain-containing protein [Deltaproteobacteria bacterium]|jgi:uncharacterized protein (TIGR01619 family)|nr:DUF695 domain-containing protein [Deltaproteobacteria bacterium]
MSDDWDGYFTYVEDRPATMLLDLGLAEEAPIPGLSVMAYITVDFLAPDENGFSGRGEDARLIALEDALVSALSHDMCLFVGRCTTGGRREFFFYMDNAGELERKVEAVLARFEEYAWDMGLVEEPGWDTYLEFLYPDEQGMDAIRNSRQCRELEARGDDLARPRSIRHRLRFGTGADRDAFIREVEREGFTAAVQGKEDGGGFALLVRRPDPPNDIDDVAWPLRELAGAHGGVYDGWDCEAVGPEQHAGKE